MVYKTLLRLMLKDRIPFLVGRLMERFGRTANSGIIMNDIESPELLKGLFKSPPDILGLRDVAGHTQMAVPQFLDRSGHRIGAAGHDGQAGPLANVGLGTVPANSS